LIEFVLRNVLGELVGLPLARPRAERGHGEVGWEEEEKERPDSGRALVASSAHLTVRGHCRGRRREGCAPVEGDDVPS